MTPQPANNYYDASTCDFYTYEYILRSRSDGDAVDVIHVHGLPAVPNLALSLRRATLARVQVSHVQEDVGQRVSKDRSPFVWTETSVEHPLSALTIQLRGEWNLLTADGDGNPEWMVNGGSILMAWCRSNDGPIEQDSIMQWEGRDCETENFRRRLAMRNGNRKLCARGAGRGRKQ